MDEVISKVRNEHEKEKSNLKNMYEEKLKEKSMKKGLNKPLFCIGLLLYSVLIFMVLVSGCYNWVFHETAYWVVGICGTALIAASVFGSDVFNKFKKL